MSLYVYLLYFENNLVIFYTTNFFEIIIFTYTYNLTKLYLSKYNSSFNYLNLSHFFLAAYVMSNTTVRSQHPVPGAMGNN